MMPAYMGKRGQPAMQLKPQKVPRTFVTMSKYVETYPLVWSPPEMQCPSSLCVYLPQNLDGTLTMPPVVNRLQSPIQIH